MVATLYLGCHMCVVEDVEAKSHPENDTISACKTVGMSCAQRGRLHEKRRLPPDIMRQKLRKIIQVRNI